MLWPFVRYNGSRKRENKMNQIVLNSGAKIIAISHEDGYTSLNLINKGCFYTFVLDEEENTVSVQKVAKNSTDPCGKFEFYHTLQAFNNKYGRMLSGFNFSESTAFDFKL